MIVVFVVGVDFLVLQVIFDMLVMGIEWFFVQEFSQMFGCVGCFDYYDKGVVYLFVEFDVSYYNMMEMIEDEVVFKFFKGEMEEV